MAEMPCPRCASHDTGHVRHTCRRKWWCLACAHTWIETATLVWPSERSEVLAGSKQEGSDDG